MQWFVMRFDGAQVRVEDPRYRDRAWLRGTRRWPPRLCAALEVCRPAGSLPCPIQGARVFGSPLRGLTPDVVWLPGVPGHQGHQRQLSVLPMLWLPHARNTWVADSWHQCFYCFMTWHMPASVCRLQLCHNHSSIHRHFQPRLWY